MKKLFIALLALMLVLTVCVSCKGKEASAEETESQAIAETSEDMTDAETTEPESETDGKEDTDEETVPLEKDTDDFTYNY